MQGTARRAGCVERRTSGSVRGSGRNSPGLLDKFLMKPIFVNLYNLCNNRKAPEIQPEVPEMIPM